MKPFTKSIFSSTTTAEWHTTIIRRIAAERSPSTSTGLSAWHDAWPTLQCSATVVWLSTTTLEHRKYGSKRNQASQQRLGQHCRCYRESPQHRRGSRRFIRSKTIIRYVKLLFLHWFHQPPSPTHLAPTTVTSTTSPNWRTSDHTY